MPASTESTSPVNKALFCSLGCNRPSSSIDKNYGGIGRKYWTTSQDGLTLEEVSEFYVRYEVSDLDESTNFLPGGAMTRGVEKLLYSRGDAARALSLSIRSIDYLICTGRLRTRRVGGKILIHVLDVRRFAKADHPEFVRVPPRSIETSSENQKTA